MNALTITGVAIRTDAQGRYCLNDLHRASGGEAKHQPANWLRMQQTTDLAAEMEKEVPHFRGIQSKQGLGTFVVKELVYAYAMWISPAFHLKVIRAYDEMVSGGRVAAPSLPNFANPAEAARAWAEQFERRAALEQQTKLLEQQKTELDAKVAEQAPKVAALGRIAGAEGSVCISDAAKNLDLARKKGFSLLSSGTRWIYRRPGSAVWIPYQSVVEKGFMELRVFTVTRPDGTEKLLEQAMVTPKGLAWLAEYVAKNGGVR
ncbi:phage antirepressor KilAC domain-containing protein [Burkholderia vietnamiensis]|uniref:KilA, N-terminal domain protein n=1 Tax=Burkholderia vietnamiensis (strain G4 / LMG 22486) TaxID=269482 RepID=A4JML3_BURVG|nr:KilA, N-terminal domain protein [Burkholderia vietnamiensis G4]MCB4342524.1 phage antirepressor KilAC domain-containing protein [Burkholderia vietnamiensis]